ncbi:MAG: signal peptidase I [Chloroflexota bacterium]
MQASLSLPTGRAAWIILALLTAIYLAINRGWFLALGSNVGTYIIRPLAWGLVIWLVLALPKYRPASKPNIRKDVIQLALLIGFIQVLLNLVGGLFSGFGKSPSSQAPIGILFNLILIPSTLVGMEFSRAWLINHLGKRHTFVAIGLIALFYTVLSIPLGQLTGIKPNVQAIDFLNSTLIPSIAENLFASFLALSAGPLAAIAYRGWIEAFWWFCPILPDLSFAFKGLIGTGVPIVGLVLMQSLYPLPSRHARPRRSEEGSPGGWIMTAIISVTIIWFSVGLFPIQPSLIGSGSMSPAMEAGDVVVFAKISADKIKVGDVIGFRRPGKITVIHRVISIQETEGERLFVTKGDANDAPDPDPVIPDNVVGKVFLTVPKVGWISAFFKGFFAP